MVITIHPADDLMIEAARAVQLRNDFRKRGVTRRNDFVKLCRELEDDFKDWQKIAFLERFWVGRIEDEDMNDKIQGVLDALQERVKLTEMAQNGSY